MGNSIDLRILVAVVKNLKKLGCHNIVVGDGCNVGIARKGSDVFRRLKINRLAQLLDFRTLDLNHASSREIVFEGGNNAGTAKICEESDLFVSLPKIKTHAEAMMSAAVKNLVGCLAGGSEKKKLHNNLIPKFVRLNEQIHPHIHIVDGLISMEGNGPGDGRPRILGKLIAGEDLYIGNNWASLNF